mmetsp:Transcript_42/g.118  ORF Transcript_42/g.118 Transcript_42/m.118 type:complete len:274 (+) Transcript_42:507-1328(+)
MQSLDDDGETLRVGKSSLAKSLHLVVVHLVLAEHVAVLPAAGEELMDARVLASLEVETRGDALSEGDVVLDRQPRSEGDEQSADRPVKLQSVHVLGLQRHRAHARHHQVHHRRVGLLLRLLASALPLVDERLVNVDGVAEVNGDCAAKLVRREVVEPHRNHRDLERLRPCMLRHGAEDHGTDTPLERKQLRAVMRPSFRKDADGAAMQEEIVDLFEHLALVHIGQEAVARWLCDIHESLARSLLRRLVSCCPRGLNPRTLLRLLQPAHRAESA